MPGLVSNSAAWANKVGEKLDVREAPYTTPQADEIIVKAHAWAVNPADWVLATQENYFDWLKFPLILGNDIAGQIEEVGSNVKRFRKSDRVLAMPIGSALNKPHEGGFQDYVVVNSLLAAPIPDSMSYSEATVFPLTLSTAACALFQKDYLGLQHPSTHPTPTGKAVLVWGGSSAVGSNAIQLAVAAGYTVFSTSSPSNFGYLKSLGASAAFDYNSSTVVDDIVKAINATQFAGILHAAGSVETCISIAEKAKGDVFVAASLPVPEETPSGVSAKMVFATTLKDNEVGPVIFEQYLPAALAKGSYKVAPEPWVVGKGLESIQTGFDAQRNGVSAKKVVITR